MANKINFCKGMSQPIQKRRRIVSTEIEITSEAFKAFLRWILSYDSKERYVIAKKLIRVCAPLRYYNVLRSIVAIEGYQDPDLNCVQIKGGFPSLPINPYKTETSWEMIEMSLEHFKIMQPIRQVSFTDFPRWVLLRRYGFANVVELQKGNTVMYAYIAPDFGLMCQFVWAMIFDHQQNGKICDGFLCLPSWNTPSNYGIYCDMEELKNFVKRKLLSNLRKMGEMAPQEYGATSGRFAYTSYAYFVKLCDTSGRRDKLTPMERVRQFLNEWYLVGLKENVCHMDLRFLTVEELQLEEDQRQQDRTLMNYFAIKR